MKIRTATFVKGVVEDQEVLDDGKPQIAFIGRSNVGKSSVINSLTNVKGLARTSSFPGRTQEVNLFLINKSIYLADLPGYGFAKASAEGRERLRRLIYWYLFESSYEQKVVVLIVDSKIGPTKDDLEILQGLQEQQKNIIIVANKVDRLKRSELARQLTKIKNLMGAHKIIPYSSVANIGISELTDEILK